MYALYNSNNLMQRYSLYSNHLYQIISTVIYSLTKGVGRNPVYVATCNTLNVRSLLLYKLIEENEVREVAVNVTSNAF